MTGSLVSGRAERVQARGHRPSRTADTRVREAERFVVAVQVPPESGCAASSTRTAWLRAWSSPPTSARSTRSQ